MATKTKKTSKTSKPTPKSFLERSFETDSVYFLKLVVVAICGTLWLKFSHPVQWAGVEFNALPLGLLLGIIFVKAFESHQSDRKIWYAVLLTVGIISYFVPAGIVI